MFNIIKKYIDEYNPIGLLPYAPDDEYDSESRKIACQIDEKSTINEIAETISKVFSNSFSEILEVKECLSTAEKIYQSIHQ